jgi:osmotically-inducible protein OsmY
MSALSSQIERRLEDTADIHVAVEEYEDTLTVSGIVTTEDERDLALSIASDLADGRRVEDNIEVGGVMPEQIGNLTITEMDIPEMPGATAGYDEATLEPGDFQEQEGIQSAWISSGPTSAIEEDIVSEGDNVFVPPTDPVGNNREVIGGLQTTSMDEVTVARSSDGTLGDEAIADAIRQELREDAATTALEIDVSVFEGVVRLRGGVPLLEDAESAEEVAARVPGVVEVREELEIIGI